MLADAIVSIHHANEAARRRRYALRLRRYPIDLVDSWLSELETLMEQGIPVVPEPLITEIEEFLGRLESCLDRRVPRRGKGETETVMEMLFEAEEYLLLRATRIARRRFGPVRECC